MLSLPPEAQTSLESGARAISANQDAACDKFSLAGLKKTTTLPTYVAFELPNFIDLNLVDDIDH